MKQRFSKRTRLVSALLTLAMVFTFLPFSAFAATDSYGPVYITDANVPDKTFREYLLKQFDKDGNGVLTPAERYAVTEIDVENKYISNLSGIQFFPNLKVLNCGHNRLTKLDVSENTVLQELVCWENQLTSLDVSQNTALQELACFENQLTSLDVRQNPALQKLSCWDNRLTSLDVSKNTELTYLKCSYNRLTELDVSKNTELTYLDCSYNRLTELDVSQNTKLTELYFVSNKITSLQADNCTNLTVIFTGSNKYKVEVYKKTRILDPGILPGNFDISRVRNLKGATQNADGTLTVQEGGGKVTYEYRCVGEIYKPFTLNVTETDDPNAGIVPPVTPPSGGGDSIAIDASNFPDPDFRTYVKAEFDKDNNNSLNDTERKTVTVINVKDKLIETLEGIESFPNLRELDCSINQLSRLDVSQNTALEKLDCSTNQLASLNLSKNAKLKYLYCSQNELTSLDVSKNTGLDLLNCNRNRLTSLDVSQTAVTTLNASDNKIDINVEEAPRTFDLSTLPGKFDVTKATNWSGGTVSGKTLKVNEGTNQVTYTYDCGKGRSETFTLNVKVVPDGTVTPPSGGDTPGGGSTPGGSTPGGGDGGGAIVIVAAAGAVAAGVVGYGVYNYVSGRKLQALLPEGVAAPENRAQTALLLWNTAGRPEPADAPAFADVADPDTAKAAQWCVEQGLMKRRLNGKFAPGSSIPAYQVLNAYRKLAG
ncbi:hypothetical protein DW855_08065 [Faecalibacterium prausnitzii]|uniref:Internalin-J n=1 Tax=Faecalibacterium prausnitzii TaxID=853 RepID=A0A3E2W4V5_9FIRM|nr:leucine-rich repeat domain-containing protein [Faecalibacterium prausnitzii]RGC18785.1 hypothetical protein DW855_08065 [Faecalibacterium prausnitzii]